jgi:FkbM family methyltransferase
MSEDFDRNLIYDVGMHQGEDSEYYLKKGFKVVAVEALSRLAEEASERLQQYIRSGQLVVLNVAIAEKDGPITFYENPGLSVWGTTDPRWAERNRKLGMNSIETTVQGMNFANIVTRYGVPYYLKVDIEGADTLCLEGLRNLNTRPKHVSIESTKKSWKSLQGEFALFKQLGYLKFKVIPQHTLSAQICPFPAKEGLYIDHHFQVGASGLFGEELDGEWLNEDEAMRAYGRIFLRHRLYGDESAAAAVWRAIRPTPKRPAEGEKSRSVGGETPGNGTGPFTKARNLLKRLRPRAGWYDTHATSG